MALLETVETTYPPYVETANKVSKEKLTELGYRAPDLQAAREQAQEVLARYEETESIASNATPQALRAIAKAAAAGDAGDAVSDVLDGDGPPGSSEIRDFAEEGPGYAAALAGGILGPANGYAGQRALLWISWVPLILVVAFGAMYISDRRKGGYKAERLTREGAESPAKEEADRTETANV